MTLLILLSVLGALVLCADDVFINFASMVATFDDTNSSTLVEKEIDTGMTPFSNRPWGWVIHKLQFVSEKWHKTSEDDSLRFALSVRTGRVVAGDVEVPLLTDQGCIHEGAIQMATIVEGAASMVEPVTADYIPGIIIAAPKLSLYIQTQNDNATIRDTDLRCRIGFLTVPMTPQRWNEVNQAWAMTE